MRWLNDTDATPGSTDKEGGCYLRLMHDLFPYQDEQTTLRFEKYLIEQQRLGWRLLAWIGEDEGIRVILEQKILEADMEESMNQTDWERLTQKLEVAPWQVYAFEPHRDTPFSLRKGMVIPVLRLAEDYATLIQLNDPVVMVHMTIDRVPLYQVGLFRLVGKTVTTLGNLPALDMRNVSADFKRLITEEDYLAYLEKLYGHPIRRATDQVCLLQLRAENDIAPHGQRSRYLSLRELFHSLTARLRKDREPIGY